MGNKRKPLGNGSKSHNNVENCYKKELSRLVNKFRKRKLGELYIVHDYIDSEHIYSGKLYGDELFIIRGKSPDQLEAKRKLVLNLCCYLKKVGKDKASYSRPESLN